MTPDFTVPQKDWRKCTNSGYTLYLPRGISVHPHNLFRVTVNNQQHYHTNLTEAWQDLVKRRNGIRRIPGPFRHGVIPRINTGVIGLQVNAYTTSGHFYVQVKVAQSLVCGHRAIVAGQCPVAEFNQAWLDRTLRTGAAMRWHYWALRQQSDLIDAVRPKDVPVTLIPDKPVKQVTEDQVWALVDQRRKAAGAVSNYE